MNINKYTEEYKVILSNIKHNIGHFVFVLGVLVLQTYTELILNLY